MPYCPICNTNATAKREPTPYWECTGCGLLFQDPLPPKLYQHPDEYDLAEMPERDQEINRALGNWLFNTVMHGSRGRTLDVGSKHPVMAAQLLARGCDALAIDGVPSANSLDVHMLVGDFESGNEITGQFDLITFVHVWEHAYDPLAMMRKVRGWLSDTGALYIRMPDSGVEGIERDFDEQHYKIHPFVHCLASIAELCARTKAFTIESAQELRPGQRDITLRPI